MSRVEMPLRRLFSSVVGGSWGSDPSEDGVVLPCVRGTDFDYPRLRTDLSQAPLRSFTRGEVSLRAARRGDLVVEKSGGGEQQPVGRVVLHDSDEIVVPTNFAGRLRTAKGVDPRFACYLLASLYSDGRTKATIKQTTGIQNLDLGALLSFRIASPDGAEQRAIADYLDVETARIDALIDKKRRMAELLNDRRRSLLAQAMSRGLSGSGDTYQTGNIFAPEVPVEWKVRRLKTVVTTITDTSHATAPGVENGSYLVVRTANVKEGQLVLEGAVYTDETTWKEWTSRRVPVSGDVMFTREAPAGEACLVPENLSLCLGQRMVLLSVDKEQTSGEWLVNSIYSGPAQEFISLLSRSTTVAHLNMGDIGNIPVVIPSLQVQEDTLAELRTRVAPLQSARSALASQVQLLTEHRQALITASVTGEFDIPKTAA